MQDRQYFIDWIRVLVFSLLIFYHSAMYFVSWGWHVKNNEINDEFIPIMSFINFWRLPLLFFISGVGTFYALKSKSSWNIVKERTIRLLIPLLFGMIVIIPPQIYFERLQHGNSYNDYLHFYKSVFEFVPYPQGSFSWHHLWFVAYLWVFSIIALPLFLRLKKMEAPYLNKCGSYSFLVSLILFVIPLSITYFTLKSNWPNTNNLISDWFNFTYSVLFFVYGYIISSAPTIWSRIAKFKLQFLIITLLLFFSISSFNVSNLGSILNPIMTWTMLLAVCGYGYKYLNKPSSMIQKTNKAVYPLYILHQTIIVIVGYYISNSKIHFLAKYCILVASAFCFSYLVYHFLIVRFKITKTLFGIK